jgi:N-methylhydantoinase A
VTDADLCLGYINPDYFLGGRMKLNKADAKASLSGIGKALGLDETEVASGSIRIVDYQMAELIRQVTIEKGYDPRDFVIFAYGGAGPTHAGNYAKELGVEQVIIPMGNISSVWSASGTAISDIVQIYEAADILEAPFDPDTINGHLRRLYAVAIDGLRDEGLSDSQMEVSFSVDMRYRAQVHVIEIRLRQRTTEEGELSQIIREFEQSYESLYGEGSGYSAAGYEICSIRCKAIGRLRKPRVKKVSKRGGRLTREAFKAKRPVYWDEYGDYKDTQVYDGSKFRGGNVVEGPAIVEVPHTTIVVHPGQVGEIDIYGNFVIAVS